MKCLLKVMLVLVLLACGTRWVFAEDEDPDGLAAKLKQHYKLASPKLGLDGAAPFEPGTILTVERKGIVAFADKDQSYTSLCFSEFRNDRMHSPHSAACTRSALKPKLEIQPEDRVCVLSIDISNTYDSITFLLADCDVRHPKRPFGMYRAKLIFYFGRGSLINTTATKVEEVVGQVLSENVQGGKPQQKAAISNSGNRSENLTHKATPSKKSDSGVPAPGLGTGISNSSGPARSNPPGETATKNATAIRVGETVEKVQQSLGTPVSVTRLETKTVHVYPSIVLIFVDGKVSQILQF